MSHTRGAGRGKERGSVVVVVVGAPVEVVVDVRAGTGAEVSREGASDVGEGIEMTRPGMCGGVEKSLPLPDTDVGAGAGAGAGTDADTATGAETTSEDGGTMVRVDVAAVAGTLVL